MIKKYKMNYDQICAARDKMEEIDSTTDYPRADKAPSEPIQGDREQVVKILTEHQKWRKGGDLKKPLDVKELSRAIDYAIASLQAPSDAERQAALDLFGELIFECQNHFHEIPLGELEDGDFSCISLDEVEIELRAALEAKEPVLNQSNSTPLDDVIVLLKDCKKEFWENWHSEMSEEQFNLHPIIEDIDKAIDNYKGINDSAALDAKEPEHDAPQKDLIKALKIKADMIDMGDRIKFGSDSELMREAAAMLENDKDYICHDCEGTAMAFACIVEDKRDLKEKLENLNRNYQSSLKQIHSLSNKIKRYEK